MPWKILIVCTLFLASLLPARAGEPVTYREIAMLLRNGETQQFILQDTAKRKLLQPLTADEEQDLATLGATPAFLAALRTPAMVSSQQDAAAYAARIQQQKSDALMEQRQQARLEAEQAAAKAPPPVAKTAPAANNDLVGKPVVLKFISADGTPIDLDKLRGKVVLIDFWATWCKPCMSEVPNVVAAYKKYHDKGFEIIGISLDQDKDAMLRVTAAQGMTWQQYFDGRGWQNEVSSSFNIQSIPTMWLIDKNGLLAYPNARGNLDQCIAKLLGP